MKACSDPARRRRRVAIDAAMVMVILVLMVQMWLLTATLESYLAGHHGVALPALLSSAALFAVCAVPLSARLAHRPHAGARRGRPASHSRPVADRRLG